MPPTKVRAAKLMEEDRKHRTRPACNHSDWMGGGAQAQSGKEIGNRRLTHGKETPKLTESTLSSLLMFQVSQQASASSLLQEPSGPCWPLKYVYFPFHRLESHSRVPDCHMVSKEKFIKRIDLNEIRTDPHLL